MPGTIPTQPENRAAKGPGAAILVLTAIILLSGSHARSHAAPPAGDPQRLRSGSSPPRYVGARSCAAAGCHGGAGDVSRPGSEVTHWARHDPHASAYATLLSPKSVEIASILRLKSAHQSETCLNCHSLKAPSAALAESLHTLSDGVSCEACHGAAERWLAPHKNAAAWKREPAERRAALGFVETKAIGPRAAQCVRCHVGGEGRDVSHELIAAGHPRMTFEMASYHAALPAHWRRDEDLRRNPSLEARLWAVGQFAAAAAAADLLERRARAATTAPPSPWPEFAEYACAACHHNLASLKRPTRPQAGRRAAWPWGVWHDPLLAPLAAAIDAGNDPAARLNPLDNVQAAMEVAGPDPEKVGPLARQLRLALREQALRADRPWSRAELRTLAIDLATSGQQRLALPPPPDGIRLDWETPVQLWLGLVAISQAVVESSGEPIPENAQFSLGKALDELREAIRATPPNATAGEANPRDLDDNRLQALSDRLQNVRTQLEHLPNR